MMISSIYKLLMTTLKALALFSFLLLALAPELAISAREPANKSDGDRQNVEEMLSRKQLREMRIHGFLLWASMGFLMPVGVLAVRMSGHVDRCGKMLFYSHLILQTVAVLVAIAGAVLAVKNFENAFNTAHQRVGLALYALMPLQLLLGFFRRSAGRRGSGRRRRIWYFMHWFAGTGLCVAAIAAVYLGLHAYRARARADQRRSTRTWTILFTAEVCLLGFVYLLQDRWHHITHTVALEQGAAPSTTHGHELQQIAPADHTAAAAVKVVGA